MSLADLIRSAREERGWTRAHLSRLAEVEYSHLTRIESGERGVSPTSLHRLTVALGLDPGEVLAAAAQRGETAPSDEAA